MLRAQKCADAAGVVVVTGEGVVDLGCDNSTGSPKAAARRLLCRSKSGLVSRGGKTPSFQAGMNTTLCPAHASLGPAENKWVIVALWEGKEDLKSS